ncbi:uncharacterized protein BXZ73DRAFT_107737 [Epithele typhae]|uniref:uncharacterized protein n=1 Tax=Epithele typhae TaxID=378194 RepID=UPI00200822B0|nr:uncharacterized protein BXZ73DRAFT_107737 [Epithele typhae]KAH9911970.1 hypothetical protein BXZ73DRAFT_107737 [Epithele typhae]
MSTHASESALLKVCHAVTEIHYAMPHRPDPTTTPAEKIKEWEDNFYKTLNIVYDYQDEFKSNVWPRYTLGAFYEFEKARRIKGYRASPFKVVRIADTEEANRAGYGFDLEMVGNDRGEIHLVRKRTSISGTTAKAATTNHEHATGDGSDKSPAFGATTAGTTQTTGGANTGTVKTSGIARTAGTSKTSGSAKTASTPKKAGTITVPPVVKGTAKADNGRQATKRDKGKGRATVEATTDVDDDNSDEDVSEKGEGEPLKEVRKTRSAAKKAVSFVTPTTPPVSKRRRASSVAPEPPKKTALTPKKRARSRDPKRTAGTTTDDGEKRVSGSGGDKTPKKAVRRVNRPAHPDHVAPEKNFEPFPNRKGRIPIYVIQKNGPNAHLRCERCKTGGTDCRIFIFDGSYCHGCRVKKAACDLSPIGHGKLGAASYRSYRAFVQLANPAMYPDPVMLSRLLLGLQDSGLVDWYFDCDPKYHLDLHVEEWKTPIQRVAGDEEVNPDSEDYPKPRRTRRSGRAVKPDVTAARQQGNESDEDDASNNDNDNSDDEDGHRNSSEPPAKKRRISGRAKSLLQTQPRIRPPSPALDPRNLPPPPPGFNFLNIPLTTRIPVDPMHDFRPDPHAPLPDIHATMRAMQQQMGEMAQQIATLNAAVFNAQNQTGFQGGPSSGPQYRAFPGHGGDAYGNNAGQGYYNPQAPIAGPSGHSHHYIPHEVLQSASPADPLQRVDPPLNMDWSRIPMPIGVANAESTARGSGSVGNNTLGSLPQTVVSPVVMGHSRCQSLPVLPPTTDASAPTTAEPQLTAPVTDSTPDATQRTVSPSPRTPAATIAVHISTAGTPSALQGDEEMDDSIDGTAMVGNTDGDKAQDRDGTTTQAADASTADDAQAAASKDGNDVVDGPEDTDPDAEGDPDTDTSREQREEAGSIGKGFDTSGDADSSVLAGNDSEMGKVNLPNGTAEGQDMDTSE